MEEQITQDATKVLCQRIDGHFIVVSDRQDLTVCPLFKVEICFLVCALQLCHVQKNFVQPSFVHMERGMTSQLPKAQGRLRCGIGDRYRAGKHKGCTCCNFIPDQSAAPKFCTRAAWSSERPTADNSCVGTTKACAWLRAPLTVDLRQAATMLSRAGSMQVRSKSNTYEQCIMVHTHADFNANHDANTPFFFGCNAGWRSLSDHS